MLVVDLWNEQRNIFLHTVGRRIADHRITRTGELLLRNLRHLCGQARKDQVAIERRPRRRDAKLSHRCGHFSRESPGACLGIGLALRAVRSCRGGHFKLGWRSSIWINRWPTVPVAPRIPTRNFEAIETSFDWRLPVLQGAGCSCLRARRLVSRNESSPRSRTGKEDLKVNEKESA